MKEDYLIRIINNLTNYGTNVGQKGQGYGDNKRWHCIYFEINFSHQFGFMSTRLQIWNEHKP